MSIINPHAPELAVLSSAAVFSSLLEAGQSINRKNERKVSDHEKKEGLSTLRGACAI